MVHEIALNFVHLEAIYKPNTVLTPHHIAVTLCQLHFYESKTIFTQCNEVFNIRI